MLIREVTKDDLLSLLELYTQLHDNDIPAINSVLENLFYEKAGFNRNDKTAFIQWYVG